MKIYLECKALPGLLDAVKRQGIEPGPLTGADAALEVRITPHIGPVLWLPSGCPAATRGRVLEVLAATGGSGTIGTALGLGWPGNPGGDYRLNQLAAGAGIPSGVLILPGGAAEALCEEVAKGICRWFGVPYKAPPRRKKESKKNVAERQDAEPEDIG